MMVPRTSIPGSDGTKLTPQPEGLESGPRAWRMPNENHKSATPNCCEGQPETLIMLKW